MTFTLKFTLAAAAIAVGVHSAAWAQSVASTAAPDHLATPAPKPGHARPLVVVVADSGGAETTDFVIPYAVLKESGVADVKTLSTLPGPVQLMRTLKVQTDATIAEFDAQTPEGADIVIVPAQMSPESPALSAWLKQQASSGATIMSICEGARVLANAGLLEGRQATSHWSSLNELQKKDKNTSWIRDRRYVQDGPIISTTGVAASVPASLALVEAIGGAGAARDTADRLGVSRWDASHRTADFKLTAGDYARAIWSLSAGWTHEKLEAPISDGVDEIALALNTDVWVRSMRTKIVTTSNATVVRGRHGLAIVPDAAPSSGARTVPIVSGPVDAQLGGALAQMRKRYGAGAERLARMGLEYDAPEAELLSAQ